MTQRREYLHIRTSFTAIQLLSFIVSRPFVEHISEIRTILQTKELPRIQRKTLSMFFLMLKHPPSPQMLMSRIFFPSSTIAGLARPVHAHPGSSGIRAPHENIEHLTPPKLIASH
jgi:hypothetical protein